MVAVARRRGRGQRRRDGLHRRLVPAAAGRAGPARAGRADFLRPGPGHRGHRTGRIRHGRGGLARGPRLAGFHRAGGGAGGGGLARIRHAIRRAIRGAIRRGGSGAVAGRRGYRDRPRTARCPDLGADPGVRPGRLRLHHHRDLLARDRAQSAARHGVGRPVLADLRRGRGGGRVPGDAGRHGARQPQAAGAAVRHAGAGGGDRGGVPERGRLCAQQPAGGPAVHRAGGVCDARGAAPLGAAGTAADGPDDRLLRPRPDRRPAAGDRAGGAQRRLCRFAGVRRRGAGAGRADIRLDAPRMAAAGRREPAGGRLSPGAKVR
ncbi:hypothetical protein CT19431_40530 [Cupriavidus taiwanensis]|nr:hypothetical protein CT19431_40530 [Cupriavidus taiwanensis]